MIEYLKTILTGQFEASLAMLNQCVRLSPTRGRLRAARPPSPRGWTEPDEEAPRIGLPKDDTLGYVEVCRAKLLETMASETATSLEGPSGFSWLPISRGELHLYNIRHIQHHTGQMSAHLRRVDPALKDTTAPQWVDTGWPKDA